MRATRTLAFLTVALLSIAACRGADTPVARPPGSMPSVRSMSSPASTLLPVVTHEPSGIQPRLSKLGSSLTRVNRDRPTAAPWMPLPGVAFDGDSGAGLSPG